MPTRTGLWRHPDFLRLWAGQSVSVFGSLVTRVALPFTAILTLDATPLQIGLLTAAELVPGLLVGLVAGVWVDRLRRRPIMIAADVGRALALLWVPLAWWQDMLRIEQLYLVGLVIGALTIFFDVAYQSYLPTLVSREHVLEGNSKLGASASVSEVAAFSVGGALVQFFNGPLAILIDAASFVWSAVFLGAIRTPEPPPAPAAQRGSMRAEITEGVSAIVHHPVLRAIAGSSMIMDFCGRIIGAVYLIFVARALKLDPALLGVLFASGGVSSFLGAAFAGRLTRWLGIGPAMTIALFVGGLGQLFIPLAGGALVLAVACLIAQQVVADGAITAYEIARVSLRQSITPDRLLGRVNAGMHVLDLAARLGGSLAGGVLGVWIGLRPTLVVAAFGVMLGALWLYRSPAWRMRSQPSNVLAAESVAAT